MSQSELFGLIMKVQEQYGALFAQIITINFAMIVAIYYFLRNAGFRLRFAAFIFYLVGMLTLVGMMLQQANFKSLAIRELRGIPADQRSSVVDGFLALQNAWLFRAASFLQNLSLWLLIAVVGYLLFWWDRKQAPQDSIDADEGRASGAD